MQTIKRISHLCAAFLISCVMLAAPAWADAPTDVLDWYPTDMSQFQEFHDPDAPRVVDDADLLTPQQEQEISTRLTEMRQRLDMDFVLYTNTSAYGLSHLQFAADFYTFRGYGIGDDYRGIVYYVCMEPGNRGFVTVACGAAQALLTEDNLNRLDDRTYDYFVSADYYQAISTEVENLDALYTKGKVPFDWSPIIGAIFIAAVFGAIMAFRKLHDLKKAMVTILPAPSIRDYSNGGPVFSYRSDVETGKTVTRKKHVDPPSSSGSGGSGGRSSYSGGFSSSAGSHSSHHSFSGGGRRF